MTRWTKCGSTESERAVRRTWPRGNDIFAHALEHAAREATVRLCLAVEDDRGVDAARAAWREARAALLAWYRSKPRAGWKRRPKRIAARIAAFTGDGAFRRAHGPRPRVPAVARDWSGVELRWVSDEAWRLVERGTA